MSRYGGDFFDRSDIGKDAPDGIAPDNYDGYYPYLTGFDAERAAWELDVRHPKYISPTSPDAALPGCSQIHRFAIAY